MNDVGESGNDAAGDDVTTDEAAAPASSSRRGVLVSVGVVVALVVVAVAAVVLWPSDASGYTDEVEANFMAACTADGGDDVEPVCGCLYDEIVETIPYDRFEEVNDALETERAADADASIQLPADFDEIRATCVDRVGATATTTTTPTTEVDPDTDATTTLPPPDTTPATTAPESPVVTSDAPNAAVPGGVRPTSPPLAPPPPPSPPGPGVPVQPPND